MVADLDGDGQAEVIFASWPKKGTGRSGQLHVLSSLGVELHRVGLPAPDIGATWNGGLGAPTLANIDADADLEVVLGTSASGVVAFDLPGTAGARVLWRTGRGGYRRTGTTELPSLTIDDAQVTEGNGGTADAVFTVRLSAPSGQTVTVDYATADGTATAPADYTATTGALSFPAGTTTRTVGVPVVGDLLDEANETFLVRLSNAAGALLSDAQATGTIVDDDPLPVLSIDDVSVAEGEAGTTAAVFTFSLSAPSGRVVSVAVATADGTATAGEDYTPGTWSMVFPPGVTTAPSGVAVVGDRVWEADETFAVNLSSPVNATLADAQGLGTILDDDPQGLSIADVDMVEPVSGTRSAVFTVTLSPPSASLVTVGYATTALTATAGSDYDDTSGTLSFDPGVPTLPLPVTVRADALAEGVETFRVDLAGPSGAAIAYGQATGRIHEPGNLFTVDPCRVLDTRDPAGDVRRARSRRRPEPHLHPRRPLRHPRVGDGGGREPDRHPALGPGQPQALPGGPGRALDLEPQLHARPDPREQRNRRPEPVRGAGRPLHAGVRDRPRRPGRDRLLRVDAAPPGRRASRAGL